jgi:hypothetical protein
MPQIKVIPALPGMAGLPPWTSAVTAGDTNDPLSLLRVSPACDAMPNRRFERQTLNLSCP